MTVVAAGDRGRRLLLRHEIDEVFDSALQEVAQRVLPLAYIEVLDRDTDAADDGPHSGSRRSARTRNTSPTSCATPPAACCCSPTTPILRLSRTACRRGSTIAPIFALYTETAVQGTLFVTAAERPSHRSKAVVAAVGMLVWPLALCSHSPARHLGPGAPVLRPVLALQSELEARGRGNLAPVGATGLPAEVGPVADAVNRLIARLQRALEAERSFTANSAHELRTPIAAALAQTQRLVAEISDGPRASAPAPSRPLCASSRACPKSSCNWPRPRAAGCWPKPQDLGRRSGFVFDDFGRAREARRLLSPCRLEPTVSRMDTDAFAILARNLIENALKHGSSEAPVTIDAVRRRHVQRGERGPSGGGGNARAADAPLRARRELARRARALASPSLRPSPTGPAGGLSSCPPSQASAMVSRRACNCPDFSPHCNSRAAEAEC